jgi:hypothetical protein
LPWAASGLPRWGEYIPEIIERWYEVPAPNFRVRWDLQGLRPSLLTHRQTACQGGMAVRVLTHCCFGFLFNVPMPRLSVDVY